MNTEEENRTWTPLTMADLNPRSQSLLVWMACLISIAGTMLILRYWAARLVKRRMFADDVLVILAYVSACAFSKASLPPQ